MTELRTIRAFYHLNSLLRRNYLAAILALPEAERLKDRGASYPSLQEIYVHVLDSLRFWFDYVARDRAAEMEYLPGRSLTSTELGTRTEEVDRLIFALLDPLTEEELGTEWTRRFPTDGGSTEVRFTVGDFLWHLIEEELQHRGELNALLWQMDREPPLGQFEDWIVAKAAADRSGR